MTMAASYDVATLVPQDVITTVVTSYVGGVQMVELKVRRVGNSLGVVLPREVANRLKVGEGETVFLTETPDGGYRISSYDPEFAQKMEKAEEIMSRYRNTLRALSK